MEGNILTKLTPEKSTARGHSLWIGSILNVLNFKLAREKKNNCKCAVGSCNLSYHISDHVNVALESYNKWNNIEKLQPYLQLWFKKGENNSWYDSSNPSTIDGKNRYKVAISWWLDWFFFLHVPSLSKCRLKAVELHQGQQDGEVYVHRTVLIGFQMRNFKM